MFYSYKRHFSWFFCHWNLSSFHSFLYIVKKKSKKMIIYFHLLLYVYRFSLTRRWKVNVECVNSVFLFQILNIDVQFIYFLNGLIFFLCILEIKTVVQVFFEDFNSSVKWSDPRNFLKARFVIFRCQKYVKKGTWKWQKKFTLRL